VRLEAAANIEQRAIVLVVVRVDVGCTSIVLHILPVLEVSLLVELNVGLDPLDVAAVADNLPTLCIVLHERLTMAGVGLETIGHRHVVGGLELALLEAACIVLAEVGVIRVACECECGIGRHSVRGCYSIRWNQRIRFQTGTTSNLVLRGNFSDTLPAPTSGLWLISVVGIGFQDLTFFGPLIWNDTAR
jgi:hypothetical protein